MEELTFDQQQEILKAGKSIYDTHMCYTGINDRPYADAASSASLAYVLMDKRFITSHDDSAEFVEIIDSENHVVKSWKLDFPENKCVSSPAAYEGDCLAFYLIKAHGLPLKIGYAFPPDWLKKYLMAG